MVHYKDEDGNYWYEDENGNPTLEDTVIPYMQW
jgi:hypothetical protein